MGLRSDRRAAAGRRGRARGVDAQRVRRDTQAGTTLEDHGPEFSLQGGKIRLRLGAGVTTDPASGDLMLDVDAVAPLRFAPDGQLFLDIRASRGLKERAGHLELVEMDPIASLTDSTTGVADGELLQVTGSGADAVINNNLAELAGKVNEILAALRATDRLRE